MNTARPIERVTVDLSSAKALTGMPLLEPKSTAMYSSGHGNDVEGYSTVDPCQNIQGLFSYTPTIEAEAYEWTSIKQEQTTGDFSPGGVASAFREVDTSRSLYLSVLAGY